MHTITITFDETNAGEPLATISGPLAIGTGMHYLLERDPRPYVAGPDDEPHDDERYCWRSVRMLDGYAPEWLEDALNALFGEWSRRGDEARAAERAAGWPS